MRLLAALLLSPALALAQAGGGDAPTAAPGGAATSAPSPSAPALPRWGLQLDAGVPDGAVASAVFRPVVPLRFSLGAAYNYVGWGMRGGVGWMPVRWAVSPILSVEVGRYLDADLSYLAGKKGVPQEFDPLLRKVGYWFASAQLGLEIGSPTGFSFSVRAGLSYLAASAHGTASSTDAASGATVTVQDPRIQATLPSLNVGFLYWF